MGNTPHLQPPGFNPPGTNLAISKGDSSCRPKLKQVVVDVHSIANPLVKLTPTHTSTEPIHTGTVITNVSVLDKANEILPIISQDALPQSLSMEVQNRSKASRQRKMKRT